MKYCTSCGAALAPGLSFCTSCGSPLAPAADVPEVAVPGQAAEAQHPGPPTAVLGVRAAGTAPWAGAAVDSGPDREASGMRSRRPLLDAASVALLAAVGFGSYLVLGGPSGDETTTRAGAASSRSGDAPVPGSAQPAPGANTPAIDQLGAPSSDPTSPPPLEPAPTVPPPSGQLVPVAVTAGCVAPPALDSLRKSVTYEPERTTDGDRTTAWRCPRSAIGTTLTYKFDRPVTLTALALVPGYDKVDPADGVDRFTENRTVSGVLWHVDGGGTYCQDIPQPTRALTSLSLPAPVTSRSVVLEIVSTGNAGARRDFMPISEVEFEGY